MAWTFYEQETLIRSWMTNTDGSNKARAERFLDSHPNFKYSISADLSKVSRLEQNGILDDTLDIVQHRLVASVNDIDGINVGVNMDLCPMPVNNVHQCAAEQHSVEANTPNSLQGHVEFGEAIHHENVCPRSMNNIELNVTKQDHIVSSSWKKTSGLKHSSQCDIQLSNSVQSSPSKLPRLPDIDVFTSNISTVQVHSIDNTNDGNHVDDDTYKIALLLMQIRDPASTFSS